MTQFARPTPAAPDYDSTIIGALELSEKKWVLAVQLPGVKRHTRNALGASGEELALLIERLKAGFAAAGNPGRTAHPFVRSPQLMDIERATRRKIEHCLLIDPTRAGHL
jgi:hypothetical protein